jgi:hypothetical protein
MNDQAIRLTSLAHGGGCGCKLAPSVLRQLLDSNPAVHSYRQLLVGTETGDDAAVWQLDDHTYVIATTDFFMPMVDEPYDFGIAAANAPSDVYAMGGKPIFALAILGMPIGKVRPAVVRRILKGGEAVCGEAGIPVAGGHSIDSPEPIYGLVVIGICRPQDVRRNADVQAGDVLILTKPLGVGIYSAVLKKGALGPQAYAEMIASMTALNSIGTELASGSPRDYRCHRLRTLGSRLGACAWLESDVGARRRRSATACTGRRLRPAGIRDGRVGAQLAELFRRSEIAVRLSRMAAAASYGSSNIRRAAGILRARTCRAD